jgi:hypothetical protein
MSETDTPTSTSTSVTATGNEAVTLADEVRKYNTTELISFLQGQDLGLSEKVFEILDNEEIKGSNFLSYKTKKDLSEVLSKYGIDSSEITKIPPFEPEPVKINDDDEELEQCITEIKRRMGIICYRFGNRQERGCALRIYFPNIICIHLHCQKNH